MRAFIVTTLLALATSGLAAQCYKNFGREQFPACQQVGTAGAIHWAVSGGSLIVGLDFTGDWDWVAVGISEGGMLGADIALAWHDEDEAQWSGGDYWSDGFVTPVYDKQQDVSLVAVTKQHGSTLVTLQRPLVSCDPNGQDRAVVNDTRQTVIYAYGNGPFAYHGPTNRGEVDLVLVPSPGRGPQPTLPPDAKVIDLRMPNYTVPSDPTTYACVNIELPYDQKYHVYRYEPVIDNAVLTHHFLGYACRGDTPPPTPLGTPYDCIRGMECEEFMLGWAPGVGAVDAPPAAALAFGAGTGVRWIVFNVHYNNVQQLQGQTDSSGFRVTYSPTLKQYDMGVLTIGSLDIAVPPGAPSWSTPPNVCPGGCTAAMAGASPGGFTVVDSFYHMHQLGRSMVTQHVRGGVELPPLGRRDYFSFDYQSGVSVPPDARQVLPGDLLITTCTYTGVGKTNVTTFGLASYEEMCFNFLTYYPYNATRNWCIALSDIDRATCATADALDTITGQDDIDALTAAGLLFPITPPPQFTPYAPQCARTAPPMAPGSGSGSGTPAPPAPHRSAGAVAVIIIVVLLVGGGIGFATWRLMRKKQRAEEEKHLFEKYDPSSVALPLASNYRPSGAAGGGGGGLSA
ncbi:hypothetical protein HYH03_008574 [Edaphochlamys debaryana]|uniref:DOMON domain-containing protein n=1 Tax=Edaphochlamys debaryana TaxID=47281 RepID=A0A836BY28_9CHLO|nr:hypothetical protein HYH03_008574 [Edaphochlamys debaryana]|eukprot:KAG2493150.1 hypothetical protein HYH03_008574 [Edaphochlamys debaryana]